MDTIIEQLSSSTLNSFITNTSWVWPSLEMVHFLGLCLLFGSLLIVDLRTIGFARKLPIKLVDAFIIITLIGFTLNVVTGGLFVVGDPGRYVVNIAFKIKMLAIIIAGFNALYYFIRVLPLIREGADSKDLPASAKFVALLSLFLWTGVIVLGRMIPYVEDL